MGIVLVVLGSEVLLDEVGDLTTEEMMLHMSVLIIVYLVHIEP